MRQQAGQYFQLVGLMLVGSALVIGIQTQDSTTELTLMAFGALIFWGGTAINRAGSN